LKTLAILTGDFPPTNIVGALRPFRLAKHLSRTGWRVLVLTNPPKDGLGLDESLLDELPLTCSIHYIRETVPFKRTSRLLNRVRGASQDILQKIIKPDLDIFQVPLYIKLFNSLLESNAVDVVLTTSPSHSIHLAGLKLKKRYNLPWVVDFRDPWDDYLLSGNAVIKNPIERFFESKVVAEASKVISTTNMYTDLLRNRHSSLEVHKFATITNTVSSSKIFGKVKKETDKLVICYTGIFSPSKDPYDFFRALRKWFDRLRADEKKKYRDRLEVRLIGSGDAVTRREVEKLDLEDCVIFYDRMPHEKAIAMTRNADLALISTGVGEKTRPGWLPSKLFEYLGCRVPILALIREGEMAQILRETDSGHVVTEKMEIRVPEILRAHIDNKFGFSNNSKITEFSFKGVDRFAEEKVMDRFSGLIMDCLD